MAATSCLGKIIFTLYYVECIMLTLSILTIICEIIEEIFFSETNSSDSTSPSHHHRRSFRRSRSISWSSVADTPTKNVEQKVMSKQTVEDGNIVDVSEVDEADLKVSKIKKFLKNLYFLMRFF
jgi:hypothetical protein